MIITRTPYRISFLGGGTDYPAWYIKYGGSVLSTAINKFCYLTCRYLPPFFEHRIRLVYSKMEHCHSIDEIDHPSARETLRFLRFSRGVEIHHDGDLPARSGMGSSSAFTVGLLHSLYALLGIMPSKMRLARESIQIEQKMIGETVGSQDQVASAFGGFNQIVFHPNGEISVHPLIITSTRKTELENHLMLLFTGIKRTASTIAKTYVDDLENKKKLLQGMGGMVYEGISILTQNKPIKAFGELMHEGWLMKRQLSSQITNGVLDDYYERARKNGAIGGKIIGAGGGGFLLLFASKKAQKKIREALKELIHVPFKFESTGSQVIFYDSQQEDYSKIEKQQVKARIAPFRESPSISQKNKPE